MDEPSNLDRIRRNAVVFIVLLGTISLFGDMTYEGGRSIAGPYLAEFGASGLLVGFVGGFGEFIGYALRFVSGYVGDRTGRYWPLMFAGYAFNLFALPLLALAGGLPMVIFLLLLERTGKAIRTPVRDAMLARAAEAKGLGWGFGLHEAMDQTGAMIGPLGIALILGLGGVYRQGFAALAIPAALGYAVLIAARSRHSARGRLVIKTRLPRRFDFGPAYWRVAGASALIAAGSADFALIAFHFGRAGMMSPLWIPVLYAIAMGASGAASLAGGIWFDRSGMIAPAIGLGLAAFATPLVFLGGFGAAVAGAILWGIGMGVQGSVLKAAIGGMADVAERATAFGLFDLVRGSAWFAGSLLLGALYDINVAALAAISVLLQLAGAIVLAA
ncbi:MAG TPA: MFS transporter [Acidiphilium sp.]